MIGDQREVEESPDPPPRLVELFARLGDAGGVGLGQMQGNPPRRTDDEQEFVDDMRRAARRQACPKCRGSKGECRSVFMEAGRGKPDRIERVWVWCSRCAGTGRLDDEGRRSSSRSKKPPEGMTAAAVAHLVAGMPRHWYLAASVQVTRNANDIRPLEQSAVERLVEPAARSWRLEPEGRQARIVGVAKISVFCLMQRDNASMSARNASSILGCSERNWRARWRDRVEMAVAQLEGWVASADDYMHKRRRDAEQHRESSTGR